MNDAEILALITKIKGAGRATAEAGKHVYGMGKRAAIAHPRSASAVGGAGGMLALQQMLKKRPEMDADAQEQRLRMSQMYGG